MALPAARGAAGRVATGGRLGDTAASEQGQLPLLTTLHTQPGCSEGELGPSQDGCLPLAPERHPIPRYEVSAFTT